MKLGRVVDVPAGRYSGGMKRRLSVAISAMASPDVVLLDEPTTGALWPSCSNLILTSLGQVWIP